MSVVLLDQAVRYLRSRFTAAEVQELRAYAGEFNAVEVDYTSFSCPAVLITVLGWAPTEQSKHITGRNLRETHLMAFVVTKNAKSREARLNDVMRLCERVAVALRLWRPDAGADLPFELAPLEMEPEAENLYSRKLDEKGLALWSLSWSQVVRPRVLPEQLFDLLRVEITDTAHGNNVPEPTTPNTSAAPDPLQVTEDIRFA